MSKVIPLNGVTLGVNNHRFNVAVRNAVNDAPLELHFLDLVYDTITYDWYVGYTMTNMVEEVINKVKDANPSRIKLIIDSEGGNAGIGIAIYNFLRSYPASVETEIIGMAGSIASVIACAADKGKLRISRNAFEVIHEAWGEATGNASDLREAADVIDVHTAQIVDIYAQRTGKSNEEIAALIANGDYWMTGTQAIELGFADDFLPVNDNFQVAARITNLDNEHYRNVPQNLVTVDTSEEEQHETTTGNNAIEQVNNLFMKFSDLVQNAINAIKGKPLNAGAQNLAEEVANHIAQPMTEMMTAIDTEVENRIETIRNQFEERIATLEQAHASVLAENEELKREVANETGKETPGASGEEKKGFAASARVMKGGK